MQIDDLIVTGLMALSNAGALIYLGKTYISKVESHSTEIAKHDSLMSKMMENLDVNSRSVIILFNKHESLNTKVEELSGEFCELKGEHKVLKNNHPVTGGNY